MDGWKEIALIAIGLLAGGVGGIIRGDWLGQRAANVVKEGLQLQIDHMRGEQLKMEERVFIELRSLSDKLDKMIIER